MRIIFSLLMVIGLVACSSMGGNSGVEVVGAVAAKAKVTAIDKAKRVVTVENEDGKKEDIKVGQEARNFDQIEVGDVVKTVYYESVALYLGDKGADPSMKSNTSMARAPKGDKPGGVVVEEATVSAIVKAINKDTRELTLDLPTGRVVTTKVRPEVKAFDKIKVGDSINVDLTRAFGISVEKPETK